MRTNLRIGKKIVLNGETLYQPDYYDDGITFGTIFKDYDAFYNNPDAVCYIPEAFFDDCDSETVEGEKFYRTDGYTRRNLELLLTADDGTSYKDEDGDVIDVENFFYGLLWACPETYFNEIVCEEEDV